jgi:hypothetical protein
MITTKRLLLLITLLASIELTHAQTNTFPTTGNVGIGTTSPASLLSALKSTSSASYGTYPAVEVNNPNTTGYAYSAVVLKSGNATVSGLAGAVGGLYSIALDNASQSLWLRSFSLTYPVYVGYNQSDLAVLNGNVLVGKTSQTNTSYKLDVNGNVRANKVIVNTTGADFVFDSSYKLLPLAEIENFVQQNHHLPQIASATEMQTNGVDIGENQTKLLQKTEELTLYLIEQSKKLKDQSDIFSAQSKQINDLELMVKQQQKDIELLLSKLNNQK